MALFLDEVMDMVHARGLDGEDRQDWVQVPAGPARRFPKRVYVRRAREGRPVREIHLSGFCIGHPTVTPISRDEASRRHRGNVRGIIDARANDDDAVIDAIECALVEVSQALAPIQPSDVLQTDDDYGIPVPELPDIELDKITQWMRERIGYGSGNARAWFLGMEEACEDALELPSRIEGGSLEDLEEALIRIGRYPDLLVDAPRLQRTWAPLIRTWLVASSTSTESPTQEAVRTYQRRRWGRSNGDSLLVELLPLPSPSLQVWPYAELGLGTRAEYQKRCLPDRIQLLADLWRSSHIGPRVAIAYGRSYWRHYRKVFGLSEEPGDPVWSDDPNWAQGYAKDGAVVVLVRHPVAFGNSNKRWDTLGRWIKARLSP